MNPAQVRALLKKYLVDPDEAVRAGAAAVTAVEKALPAILTGAGSFLLSHLIAQEVGLEPKKEERIPPKSRDISPKITLQLPPLIGVGYKQAGSVGESIEPPENWLSWQKSEQQAVLDEKMREKDARHMIRKVLRRT